ncbi:uncharacterized protein [Hetaerina americana]|uniref:uncharacterized protein n=1 Tax=Hetaerina americana TaxID=62018 RepID=UPI003A7F1442
MAPGLWTKLLITPNISDRKVSAAIDIIGRLPEEISVNILRMLDNASLVSCTLVSKRWLHVIHSDQSLRFRVFNRLRRLRWLKQKLGEQKAPKGPNRIVTFGVERVNHVIEKYHKYKDRKEEKRRAKWGLANPERGRVFSEYVRRKILRGPKELVPGLDIFGAPPLSAQTAVYRQQSVYGEGDSFR